MNAAATAGVNGFGERRPGYIPHSSRRSSSSPPGRDTGAANPTATPLRPEQETTRNHRREQSSRSPKSASPTTPAGKHSSRNGSGATPATSYTDFPVDLGAAGERRTKARAEQGKTKSTTATSPPPERHRQEANTHSPVQKEGRGVEQQGSQIHHRRPRMSHRPGWIWSIIIRRHHH